MKYSYRWLKELTGTKKTAQEIINLINLRGFEFEGKEDLAKRFAGFVVGKVLKVEKHPHADRLKITRVDVGSKEGGILSIVCGAPNVATGQKVPVALVGAILPTNGVKIERTLCTPFENHVDFVSDVYDDYDMWECEIESDKVREILSLIRELYNY